MAIIKKKINGKVIDVYTVDNLPENNSLLENSGLLIDGTVYPFKKKTDRGPGIYDTGMSCGLTKLYVIQEPKTEEEIKEYDIKTNSVDFNNKDNLAAYMKKMDSLKQMERSILMNVDSVYKPVIRPDDTKEMKAFKYAVGLKNCDITAYKDRFGSNYNNDKRLFEKDSITMKKMSYLTDILDMNVEIIFRDKSPDVPNPMGKEVRVCLDDTNDFDQFLYEQQQAEQDRLDETQTEDEDPDCV